ncbi:MAG: hypothetical protein GXO73_08235 [Calditrichaeota bacterium]|nr:hypothetical protein [Calditrichota bacterium]
MRRAAAVLLAVFVWVGSAVAGGDRVLEFRLTLSGHVLLGVGVRQQIQGQNWADAGVYVGLADTWNFGLHAGAVRLVASSADGTGALSLGYDQMFALDPGAGWRTLPLIRGTAGYYFGVSNRLLGPEVWVAYFLRQHKLAPIGIGLVSGF